jgi:hypothetical protein
MPNSLPENEAMPRADIYSAELRSRRSSLCAFARASIKMTRADRAAASLGERERARERDREREKRHLGGPTSELVTAAREGQGEKWRRVAYTCVLHEWLGIRAWK